MQNPTSNSRISEVRARLKQAYTGLKRRAQLNRLLTSLSIFPVVILLFILAETRFYFSPAVKSVVLLGTIAAAIIVYLRLRKANTLPHFDLFYRNFSRSASFSEVNYALDLENDATADPDLVQAAIEQNMAQVDPRLFDEALSRFQREHSLSSFFKKSVSVFSIGSLLFMIGSFAEPDAALRMSSFWQSFEKPNPYQFVVSPGNKTLEQGTDFSASIQFEGNRLPERVSLRLKTSVEDEYRTRAMEFTNGRYESAPLPLNNDLEYFIQMDEYKSEVFNAQVQLRPRFTTLDAVVAAPSYTSLDTTRFNYPFSLIRAYQGSTIELSGILNKEVEQALLISKTGTDTLNTEVNSLIIKREVGDRDTLSFAFRDANGLTNRNSFQFVIEPMTDQYPVAEMVEPASSFEMVEPKKLELLYKASDDFQVTRARLRYELRKAYVNQPETGSRNLDTPPNGVLQNFEWDVSDMQLSPLDELTFWIEATDNDGYNGFKTSRSQSITLTVPSLVDYFEGLDERESDVGTELEEISDSFEEMEQQYEEFKESLRENPETNYEQRRQLEEVARQQEEMEERIRELNEEFESIKEELSENNLLSEETQQAYEELQKLMEEIDDPAFQEALKQLMEQFEQLSPEQLRQAMENFEFNEELYKQRLDRTIELFKQLKLMSDLEKLAKAFEDQARQEEELKENPLSDQELENKRQQDLEQLERLKESLDDLSENTPARNKQQVEEYQQQSQSELDKIRQEIQEQLNQSGESDSPQNQNAPANFNEQYQQLAEQTNQMIQQMGQQQQQINIAGLQYILYSLINISDEQELLVTSTEETESRSLAYVEYARDQRNVQQIFTHLSDSLFQLSSQIPQLSNQVNEKKLAIEKQLTRSIEQMAERDRRNSSVASRQAFGGINELSFMIANLLEQLQNANNQNGGAGGNMSLQQMMEQMGNMQRDQAELNQQIQNMINDIQGERLNQDQMERLNQLARQQNQIRKQLEELQRSGGADGDRIGSELERMIEEMENTINDLRGGAVDPLLIERQQNIMSRMLEAEKALQERDEEERREGTTADPVNRVTPPEMTLEELEKQIRSRLNDPNFTKYAPDYQRLIERYFELLKQLQEREL